LDESSVEVVRRAASAAIGRWAGQPLDLVTACRAAAYDVLSAVLFGWGAEGHRIGADVRAVVDARRARRTAITPADRRQAYRVAVHASRALATRLSAWLDGPERGGLLASMDSDLASRPHAAAAEATALCAASTEPVAASLAWIVLVLTQRPDLQEAIRDDVAGGAPGALDSARPRPLLERVLLETQRLLPSSAMVTRATVRQVELAGVDLPAGCEVVVSSLLAHRDPERFVSPVIFRPGRWAALDVTPFEFFPFGAGVRACLGAAVARTVLDVTLRRIVADTNLRLAFDAEVGWRLPDAFTPSPGVPLVVEERPGPRPGRAIGPISRLIDFGAGDA
jgi:cytochrome P450